MKKIIYLIPLFFSIIACAAQPQPTQNATDMVNATLTAIAQNNPQVVTPQITVTPIATQAQPTASQGTLPPAQCVDTATFVADVTIPDGTVVEPNQAFTKIWRLQNSGTCVWTTAYSVVLEEGPQNSAWIDSPHPFTSSVAPGQSVDVSVTLTAPAVNATGGGDYSGGTTTAFYQLRNAGGVSFLSLTAVIKVHQAASQDTIPSAQCVDTATFVADVTIPDGTVVEPNQTFTKIWRLKNSGTCVRTTAYSVVLEEGPQNSAWIDSPHPFTSSVAPGQSVDVSVTLTAPAVNATGGGDYSGGTTTAFYQLRNAEGVSFLSLTALIKVHQDLK